MVFSDVTHSFEFHVGAFILSWDETKRLNKARNNYNNNQKKNDGCNTL